ncbi:MAG: DNA-directed DNA polymerase [Candidatus Micrarchaeota archaeon]|nr:DNA-directed DNA polymerase [Candidatus Micrarchaeota archaeon]
MEKNSEKKIKIKSAILLDTDYIIKNDETIVRLLLKAKKTFYLYDKYLPYFYVDAPYSEAQKILALKTIQKGREIKPIKIEQVKKIVKGKEKELLKVYFKYPSDVPIFRELIKTYEKYEYDILFGRRYLIDKGLGPFYKIKYKREGRWIKEILGFEEKDTKLRIIALDIETYNPQGMPRPDKDPILMISYYFLDEENNIEKGEVLSYKKSSLPYVKVFENEKEIIENFVKIIKELDPEVLVGFNSANFDIPYIIERAKKHNIKLDIAKDGTSIRIDKRGQYQKILINGRVHIDLYPVLRFFSFIGTYKLNRYTLETAYQSIVQESEWKKEIDRLEIYKIWDEEKNLDKLFEYSLFDARATLEITKKILPLEVELSKVTCLPLSDTIGATSSQLIESLILHHATKRNEVVPNKPDEQTARERALNPIEGAFVKTPNPGIYEKIMVFDFRGLYPSIIISHNIDPFTIIAKEEEHKYKEGEYYVSPIGVKFLKEPKGIIPYILEKILNARSELKNMLKKLQPASTEYKTIWARQQSLKILANSYYGYLAFARSRYYSRACAQSITAWGRYFINKTIEDAQKNGFEVLYADTDSVFLLLNNKTKQDALNWMEKYNSSLPGTMELELEAYYPRGVFVSKKIEKKEEYTGAKKKYALLDENGGIKIRGFELVRRDWAIIAKETQKKVLEAILKEGSQQKAIDVVKETIKQIRENKVPIEKMIIETQLTKNLEDYEAKSPELVAALKFNRKTKGEKLTRGSIIRFVITKDLNAPEDLFKNCKRLKQAQTKKSSLTNISLKAETVEYAKNYDSEYYINHQVIPAVLRILKELGINADDLKLGGNQKGLFQFD